MQATEVTLSCLAVTLQRLKKISQKKQVTILLLLNPLYSASCQNVINILKRLSYIIFFILFIFRYASQFKPATFHKLSNHIWIVAIQLDGTNYYPKVRELGLYTLWYTAKFWQNSPTGLYILNLGEYADQMCLSTKGNCD